jgi:amino-acid N-acetyltransferase
LSSTSTKREAKSYLQRFTPQKADSISGPLKKSPSASPDADKAYYDPIQSPKPGVNLGGLYLPITSIDQSPTFSQESALRQPLQSSPEGLHVAIVKIRSPQTIEDSVLNGIGLTLSQLGRLGLSSVVVVDVEDESKEGTTLVPKPRNCILDQADRVTAAINHHGTPGAQRLDNILGFSEMAVQAQSAIQIRSQIRVLFRDLLVAPLRRGLTPVIAPLAYSSEDQKIVNVTADEVVLALTRELAGFIEAPSLDEDPRKLADLTSSLQRQGTVDRIIICDPLGGIPSGSGHPQAHVFINLEQEADMIRDELLSNFSSTESKSSVDNANVIHLKNLKLARDTLALLPPSSSALLTTPKAASNSGPRAIESTGDLGVGTRRQKNPLIHNLLTDKPSFSSSLPSGRLRSLDAGQVSSSESSPSTKTTFVKRGMPLTILPDPRIRKWTAPGPGDSKLSLKDPRIDLPRLIDLIEDSFNRKLDVEHYLSRVNDRIAGVIIAGEYEGGALLTWECPPGVSELEIEGNQPRMVPYLDKFAVRKRSQGAGGVADIVFKSMVRDCFPDGVCWRSRKNNPVNKWYFERARGTWKISRTNWTMFWTTEKASTDRQTFLDYEAVCRAVVPSWADNKDILD